MKPLVPYAFYSSITGTATTTWNHFWKKKRNFKKNWVYKKKDIAQIKERNLQLKKQIGSNHQKINDAQQRDLEHQKLLAELQSQLAETKQKNAKKQFKINEIEQEIFTQYQKEFETRSTWFTESLSKTSSRARNIDIIRHKTKKDLNDWKKSYTHSSNKTRKKNEQFHQTHSTQKMLIEQIREKFSSIHYPVLQDMQIQIPCLSNVSFSEKFTHTYPSPHCIRIDG